MRYFLLLLTFALAGCAYSYPVGYGYGYNYPGPPPGYGPVYGQTPPAYAYNETGYPAQASNTENCGTPFEFRACPPLPRHPLPYYPANRS